MELRLGVDVESCLVVLFPRRLGWLMMGDGSGSLNGGGRARDVEVLSRGLVCVGKLCDCVAAGVGFS